MHIRIDALLREARTRVDSAEAELLLAHLLRKPRSWLFAHADELLDPPLSAEFSGLLARREAGEPVAYLTGRRGFWSLDLQVTPDTLIPRPETELLVELALARLPAATPVRVADLGTGSGAIALAIAHERPKATVVATDASAAALAVASRNARNLRLKHVDLRQGEWMAPLGEECFDLIASNPPYIAEHDAHLDALRHEPRAALTAGADGLDDIRTIAAQAPVHLLPGGWLLLEHGFDQGDTVRRLLLAAGLADVATHQDLEARDRVTLGRLPA